MLINHTPVRQSTSVVSRRADEGAPGHRLHVCQGDDAPGIPPEHRDVGAKRGLAAVRHARALTEVHRASIASDEGPVNCAGWVFGGADQAVDFCLAARVDRVFAVAVKGDFPCV